MIKSWCCLCFCLLLLLGGCNRQGKGEREPLSFSPFVEAFTSGTVSRNAPVYLVFSQAVDTAKMDVRRWLERLLLKGIVRLSSGLQPVLSVTRVIG